MVRWGCQHRKSDWIGLIFLQARHIDSLSTPSSSLLLLLCVVCDVEVPQLVYPAHHAAHVKTMSTRSPDAMASMRRCEARQSDSRLATADDDVTTTARLSHLLSLLDAITRSQSRTLCFFRYFFVRYLRYLQARQQATFGNCLQVTQLVAEVQAMQVNRTPISAKSSSWCMACCCGTSWRTVSL